MYLARELTGAGGAAIGERFGGVGPAAVSRTVAKARERLAKDRQWRQQLARCETLLA
jgi:chromosomal replication initiation ATPase DnaA